VAEAEPAETPSEREESLRRLDTKILRGSVWTAVGYGGGQLLAFLSLLVVVRLVEPKAFGLVALAAPFLVILQYVQESGLASALVQRRGSDIDRAAATVLVFSPVMSALMYGICFALAPLYAHLVHTPALTPVLRVLALIIFFQAIGIVPNALLERAMRFRFNAQARLGGTAFQFATTIALAAAGFDVWALVAGQLVGQAATSCLYWLRTPFVPNPTHASLALLREMGRYGRFVSAGNIVNVVNTTADNIIIGRLLGAASLGFYAVAFRIATMPNSVIALVVGRVMFSVYSSLQNDLPAIRRVYIQNLQRIAIFALPVSVGLIVGTRPFVLAVLGERWAPAIGALRLLAIYGLVRSFVAPCGELFRGLGRPSVNLYAGICFAAMLIPALILLIPPLGLEGAPLAFLIGQVCISIPVWGIAMRMIGVRGRDLSSALMPLVASAGLLAAVLLLTVALTRSAPALVSFTILVLVGAATIVAGAALFAREIVVPMWVNLRARGA
jgi:O-antigen/teichoic acid export membrane protein